MESKRLTGLLQETAGRICQNIFFWKRLKNQDTKQRLKEHRERGGASGETAQQIRAVTALLEDPYLVSSSHLMPAPEGLVLSEHAHRWRAFT